MVGDASRENGRKYGGRPVGSKAKLPFGQTKQVKQSLMEAAQAHELEMLAILLSESRNKISGSAASRITAALAVIERARGKAQQNIAAEGDIKFTVLTGVPEPDDGPMLEGDDMAGQGVDFRPLEPHTPAIEHIAEPRPAPRPLPTSPPQQQQHEQTKNKPLIWYKGG